MENEKQLRERLTKLGVRLKIKDDPIKKILFYRGTVDGKEHKSIRSYKQTSKEKAMVELTKKQEELIKELTIDIN